MDVVIVGACRTPIGNFGGAFKDLRSNSLSVIVLQELVKRTGIDKSIVDDVIWGECHQQADQTNIARVAAIQAGFPKEVTGVTINRVCTSAMQAIVYGTQAIQLKDAEVIIAGGVESMSSAPYVLRTARWGQRLRHGQMLDTVWEGFTCGACGTLMGMTAENLAQKYGISREEQDEIALRSNQNASKAIEVGKFKDEIVPVPIPQRNREMKLIDTDERPRNDLSMESLASLPPVFKEGGTVTAGNSSGINDGSAGVVLMSEGKARDFGIKPMARILGYAGGGCEPELMGFSPVPATRKLLEKTGLTLKDIDLFEVNEAFAGQYLAVEKALGLDRARVNVNGSGVALGHPVGCTGARIVVTLLYEMIRRNCNLGLATLCGLGGVGLALALQRC